MDGGDNRREDQAALRAALVAADASFEAARANLTAATSVRAALRAALGEGEEIEIVALEDRDRWLTIKEAAGVARCHPKTIERRLPDIAVMVGGRWYVDRYKLLKPRAR